MECFVYLIKKNKKRKHINYGSKNINAYKYNFAIIEKTRLNTDIAYPTANILDTSNICCSIIDCINFVTTQRLVYNSLLYMYLYDFISIEIDRKRDLI